MPRLHHLRERPLARRRRERAEIDPPCVFCGAYAARCSTDRDDGTTVCATTGRTVPPAKGTGR